jgi:hypothetical protein
VASPRIEAAVIDGECCWFSSRPCRAGGETSGAVALATALVIEPAQVGRYRFQPPKEGGGFVEGEGTGILAGWFNRRADCRR